MEIEWLSSRKDNIKIPRVEGHLLASRAQPVREAENWLIKYKNEIEKNKIIFVLGYGSGLHIRLLVKKYPQKKILCFEKFSDLIYSESISAVSIVSPHPVVQLWQIPNIEDFVLQKFCILKFDPCVGSDPAYYSSIVNQLTGRDISSFRRIIQLDQNLSEQFRKENIHPTGIVNDGTSLKLLTIKDLLLTKSVCTGKLKKSHIWKVLGELVL